MSKKVHLSFWIAFILSLTVFSQARLVLNNNPYIVLNGGTAGTPLHLVLGNAATNAITWTGTSQASGSGGIKSEGEYNIVQWNLGTSSGAGTHLVPFVSGATDDGVGIGLSITGAGVGAGGVIKFSTYKPITDQDANLPYPTSVTNLNSSSASALGTGGTDNSYRVVDRFYIVDASGYGTRPSAGTLTFYYDSEEETNGSNDIDPTLLTAQRYDFSTNDWYTHGTSGSRTAGSGTYEDGYVGSVSIGSAAAFQKIWALVDNRAPLPIELIEFKSDCEDGQPNLYWTTATETNNKFFTIEKSVDGKEFVEIATVASLASGGYSTGKLNYHYIDKNTVAGTYYRLKQTDYDGKFEYSKIIFGECNGDISKSSSVDVYPNPSNGVVNVLLTGYENQNIQITIMNSVGQIIANKSIPVGGAATTQKESFSLIEQAKGIYYVSVISDKEKTTHKVINQY